MPYDAEAPAFTPTSHKADMLTATSALALYDAAITTPDKVRAAAAMADVLRRMPAPKVKPPKVKPASFVGDFAAALKRIGRVVERRNTIPILSNVRLTAEGDAITLVATNLDMEESIKIRGYSGPALDVTVEAHVLQKIITGAESLRLEPSTDGTDRLLVVAGDASVKLPTLPVGDFPTMVFESTGCAMLDAADLRNAMKFVSVSISPEETRYYLNGMYFEGEVIGSEGGLNLVSTDGSGLRLDRLLVDWSLPSFILPKKTVDMVLARLGEGDVLVDYSGLSVRFTFGDGSILTSKLIDGSFPDYRRVIPTDDGVVKAAIEDPKAFCDAARRLLSISAERSRSIRLRFSDHLITGTVRNMERGDATSGLPGYCSTQGDVEVGVNGSFLLEMIAEPGVLHVGGPNDPLRYDHDGRPNRVGILMPLRV